MTKTKEDAGEEEEVKETTTKKKKGKNEEEEEEAEKKEEEEVRQRRRYGRATYAQHFGPCVEAATKRLRMELALLRLQKEQAHLDSDDKEEENGLVRQRRSRHDEADEPPIAQDLMTLVMETELVRLRQSTPQRVRAFNRLYEENLRRAEVRKEVLEMFRQARKEEKRKAALACIFCDVKKSPKHLHFLEKVEVTKCSEIVCPVCSVPLSQIELKALLSEAELERYLRASVEEVLLANKDRYLMCPNSRCKNIIEKVDDPIATPKDTTPEALKPRSGVEWTRGPQCEGGAELSPEAARHRDRYRFRCRECGTECCGSCQAVPYHLGLTCEQYALWLSAKRCRYCDIALETSARLSCSPSSPTLQPRRPRRHSIKGKERREREEDGYDSDDEECIREAVEATQGSQCDGTPNDFQAKQTVIDCCTSLECATKARMACTQSHSACGHPCAGICGEDVCPPCLHIDCSREGMQTGTDLCLICYVEELRAAPCIRLSCGHFFHFECAKNKVTNGWSGSRITFGYLECPLCKQLMRHSALEAVLAPALDLYNLVKEKALQRLRLLSLDKSDAITSPSSVFYGNPVGYSLHRFSFYLCYKCKTPYFGGDKICEAEQQAREFNPKDLVCGRCCDLSGINDCPEHGREFIEYKCRFCCSVAVWFCWGTTHFCDSCHQNAAELITADKRELPSCTCGINHPPNGEEFSLGCSYCRTLRD